MDFLEFLGKEINLASGLDIAYDLDKLIMKDDSILHIKSAASLLREFDHDVYGPLLREILEEPNIEFSEFEDLLDGENDEYIFYNNKHFLGQNKWLRSYINQKILSSVNNLLKYRSYNNIYEYGSGYGSKIINLGMNLSPSSLNLYAIDLSDNGLSICRHFSKKYHLDIKTIKLNFELDDISYIKVESPSIIISSFGLHYLNKFDKSHVEKLVTSGYKAGVHFEPCTDMLYKLLDPLYAKLALKYARQNNYTCNLGKAFKDAASSGLIDLTISKDVAGFGLLPGWLIQWQASK